MTTLKDLANYSEGLAKNYSLETMLFLSSFYCQKEKETENPELCAVKMNRHDLEFSETTQDGKQGILLNMVEFFEQYLDAYKHKTSKRAKGIRVKDLISYAKNLLEKYPEDTKLYISRIEPTGLDTIVPLLLDETECEDDEYGQILDGVLLTTVTRHYSQYAK